MAGPEENERGSRTASTGSGDVPTAAGPESVEDSPDPHGHHASHPETKSLRPLAVALAINTTFFVIEVAGALLADSVTLLADAAHMLTDSGSLALALFAAWAATRQPDARRTYGYHRAEVLGALANGVLLVVVVGYVLIDAIGRFGAQPSVDPVIIVAVGVLGLLANLAAAWVLTGHRESLNVEGAFLHLLADAAGSVAAIVAGLVIWATGLVVVDAVMAILIAGLVLYSARDLLAESLNILLQGTPAGIDLEVVSGAMAALEEVQEVHHLHIWALDSRRVALSAHVVAAEGADTDTILERCRTVLRDRFDISHATLQVESGAFAETHAIDCRPDGSDQS